MQAKLKEVPPVSCASFTVKGQFYETSYAAQRAAIKEAVASHKKDAVIVLDDKGDVDCTVCKYCDGLVCVYGDGRVDKYKSITSLYDDEGKIIATVALVSGRIIQL